MTAMLSVDMDMVEAKRGVETVEMTRTRQTISEWYDYLGLIEYDVEPFKLEDN
jgi:hypothetical protein